MQTQYYLLYRYVNPSTNTAITNEADYNKTEEFYTSDHKLYITETQLKKYGTAYKDTAMIESPNNKHNDDVGIGYELSYKAEDETLTSETYTNTLKSEADKDREQIITQNMANNDKSNNLYIYTGTTKKYHDVYVPRQLGYLVRDWTRVPKTQLPTGPDDYSKHFVMLNGTQLGVGNTILVCKPQYLSTYYTHKSHKTNMEKNPYTQNISDINNIKLNKNNCFMCFSTEDLQNKGWKYNSKLYHKNIVLEEEVKKLGYNSVTEVINEATFFAWADPNNKDLMLNYKETIVKPNDLYGTLPLEIGDPNKEFKKLEEAKEARSIIPDAKTGKEVLWNTFKLQQSYIEFTTVKRYYIFYNNYGANDYLLPFPKDDNVLAERNISPGELRQFTGWSIEALAAQGYSSYGQSITIDQSNIIRYIIPEHYENSGTLPYIIKDNYEKIKQSPWMLHSVKDSLESALDTARKLVSMIGMENVKLIKRVPFDQKIEIK